MSEAKLLTREKVERARERLLKAAKVLQGKYPSPQSAIDTLTELADDLLAELQALDEADGQICDDLLADLQTYRRKGAPSY